MPFINIHVLFPTVGPSQPELTPAKRLPGDVAELEDQYHQSLQEALKLFEAGFLKLEEGKRHKIKAIKVREMKRAMEAATAKIDEVERQHEETGK